MIILYGIDIVLVIPAEFFTPRPDARTEAGMTKIRK
jgi:hypothetical protein